jgi:hypothetical protein
MLRLAIPLILRLAESKSFAFLIPSVGAVDTPGFDGSCEDVSNTDTLRMITNFLLDECVYISNVHPFFLFTDGNFQDTTTTESSMVLCISNGYLTLGLVASPAAI